MSTFVLKREYALQMPTNYVEIDRDEMEYVDGGGWYLSNKALTSVLTACALNPIGTTLFALGYWKVVSLLSAKWSLFLAKLGSVGGFIGSAAGFVIGALTAASVATTVVDALWAGKGIEFGFTWRPTLTVR